MKQKVALVLTTRQLINIIVFLTGLLIKATGSFAQESPMKHLTKLDGLPSNTIYDIYRDSKGMLWFASDKGIARYNGISFQTYTTSNGLPDNEVFFFQEDGYGRLWLGTYNGALCYFKNDTFHTAANTPFLKLPYTSSFIKYINRERNNKLIIGFAVERYFLEIDGEHIVRRELKDVYNRLSNVAERTARAVTNITLMPDGNYHVFREDSLFTIDSLGKIIGVTNFANVSYKYYAYSACTYTFCQNVNFVFDNKSIYDSSLNPIRSFGFEMNIFTLTRLFFYKNKLFIGMLDGLIINDADAQVIQDSLKLLKGKKIAAISNDRSGNVWVGTLGDGIYILPGDLSDFRFFSNAYKENLYYVTNIGGKIYFITGENNVQAIEEKKIRSVFSYHFQGHEEWKPMKPGYLIDPHCQMISLYRDKCMRVDNIESTNPQVSIFSNRHCSDGIHKMYLSNRKLVTANNVFLVMYDIDSLSIGEEIRHSVRWRQSTVYDNRVYGTSQDRSGNIWCTTQNGVFKFDGNSATEMTRFKGLGIKNIYFHNDFLIATTPNNLLLIYRLQEGNNRIDTIPEDNCVWDKVYSLDHDHVLISTNNQYRVLTLSVAEKCQATILYDQFLPIDCEAVVSDSDYCYFFKDGSITQVRMSRILSTTLPPQLYFNTIKSLGKNFGCDSTIQLTFREGRDILLSFVVVGTTGQSISYQYTIQKDGFNDFNWHDFNGSPLLLSNMAAGKYTINIRAKANSGVFSKLLVYRISIDYPYWQTWWFIGLCIAFILLCIWLVVRKRIGYLISKRQKEHETDVRYMKSEYKALNALMNPHFIFNALNNVQGLVNSGDKRSANEYLRIFADLVRQNMHNVSMELIPMAKELELVRNYLLLEKLRFDNKLQYSIDIDEAIDTTELLIPPLVIQPLVENAIKHGILPLQNENGELLVKVFEREESYIVEIWDNGVGFSSSSTTNKMHQSFGLENLRKRIDYLKQINTLEMELLIEERKKDNDDRKWTVVSVMFK